TMFRSTSRDLYRIFCRKSRKSVVKIVRLRFLKASQNASETARESHWIRFPVYHYILPPIIPPA
ncbi:hypothetical protein L9F63_003303, partial [Diploptera punctata]